MNNEQAIPSDMCSITENNLEAVLFSEFPGSENMILTSANINNLSELEGTLCYDETTNELVYVNMIQPNLNGSESLVNTHHSVLSLGNSSTLTDISTFNDGNAVMLLTNGSVVIPNEDNNLVSSNTDPYILQFVQNQRERITNDGAEEFSDITNTKQLSNMASSTTTLMKRNDKKINVNDILNPVEPNYRCHSCSKTFSQNKEYHLHLMSHKEKIHKCSHCGNSFNKLKNLILHEALHNPTDTICPLSNCQKKFKRLASLKAHIKLHEEEETLTCTECGEEFRNQMNLEMHYKYQPQCRFNFLDNDSETSDSLVCKLCNRKFPSSSALTAHKKEHEKIKKALATKNHRKKTGSSKQSARINRCKICPKWFLKPSQLIRHMRIHTGERPFECSECHKAFNQANSLKIHMLKHTGDRPYLCPFCHSGFSQRGNLRQHINRVHSIPKVEDLVYECSECPCMFKKICSLNAHRNRVHRKGYKLLLPESSENAEEETYLSGCQETILDISKETNDKKDQREELKKMVKTLDGKIQSDHMYMCPECTNTFKTLNALQTHVNEVHVKLPTPRNEQENSITLENNLDDLDEKEVERLLKKQTTVNTITIAVDRGNGELWNQKVFIKKSKYKQIYQCSHCPKESLKLNEMIRHIKVNVVGKVFKCEYCSKTFSQQSTFKTHLSLHATAKTYHCQVCQYKFSNPAELNAHLKTHNQMKNDILCMTCLKTYSSEERDKHHCLPSQTLLNFNIATTDRVAEVNDVQHLRDKVNLILPPYVCSRCNITFKSYTKLKSHIQDHDSKACKRCNSRFASEDKLHEHINATHQCEIAKTVEENHLKYGRRSTDARSLARQAQKSHPENRNVNVANTVCDQALSVSNNSSNGNMLTKNVIVNASTNLGNTSIGNDVNEFILAENNVANIDVHQTIDYTVPEGANSALKNAFLVNNTLSNVKESVVQDVNTKLNEQTTNNCENLNTIDNSNNLALSIKNNNVSYVVSSEPLDCFIDSQMTTLPLSSEIPSENSIFNLLGDIIYKCTSCCEQYSTELDLQKHFQESEICNNGIPDTAFSYFYACNTCYLTFKSLPSFLRHLQTHNGTETYSCVYCETPNKTEAELTQHIAAHALKKVYPCVHCGELAETAEAVKKHITDVHLMSSVNSKMVETKRKKMVGSELLLSEKEKLMLVDQKPNKYSSISEKVLSSLLKKNAKKPMDDIRDELPAETETVTKTKKKRANSNTKDNKCSYCYRSFKKMCDLIRHVRIHTGEKPFKCDYCSKCFTVKSILNCHLKTHFTVKNIFCHVCNRFFSTVGSLKIHMRLHTGDRPYKCLYCKESFRTSGHRDSHQKRHAGQREKARATAVETGMANMEEQENLDLSLGEAINLQDGNFFISEITDIEDFKFNEDIDLGTLNILPSSNDCSVCGKSFKKKMDLEKHISVHYSDRELKSNVQSEALKEHVKKQMSTSQVQCDVCHKSFASAKNLKVHKVRQHPETLELPFQDDNESMCISEIDKSDVSNQNSEDAHFSLSTKDKNKWTDQDLNLSALAGKNKKSDVLNDFFIMEKQFDLNSMISDFFPDDDK